jgi:probable phosphoglycerate mutase
MTTIYLLRHGALAGDSRDRFIGQLDLPSAPEGIRQAEALARALRDQQIDALHCSDLLRSRQTAEIIAGITGISIEKHPELREISLGDWEGLSRREAAARFPTEFAARGRDIENYRIPGGESFADCIQRALPVWNALLGCSSERIAIVGHAGVNRLLLCHLLGMPVANLFRIGQDYGCVNIIEQDGERIRVGLVNGRPGALTEITTKG